MRRNAFTLAGLLVVIAVIGVVATIVYTQFGRFKTKAKLREVENTVQLILAAEKYYFFRYPPPTREYFRWSDWSGPGNNYAAARTNLRITIPGGDDAACEYRVQADNIEFRRNDNDVPLGSFNITSEQYTIIDGADEYTRYLEYLE